MWTVRTVIVRQIRAQNKPEHAFCEESLKFWHPVILNFWGMSNFFLIQLADFQHYSDVMMGGMASEINILTIVYSAIHLGVDKKTSKLRVTGVCEGNSQTYTEYFFFVFFSLPSRILAKRHWTGQLQNRTKITNQCLININGTCKYVCRWIVNVFYCGRILLTVINTPISKVWGSASRAQPPLPTGIARRPFPS